MPHGARRAYTVVLVFYVDCWYASCACADSWLALCWWLCLCVSDLYAGEGATGEWRAALRRRSPS